MSDRVVGLLCPGAIPIMQSQVDRTGAAVEIVRQEWGGTVPDFRTSPAFWNRVAEVAEQLATPREQLDLL